MTALTTITAPSRKLILTIIALVVGAHLLTGGALSQIAPASLPPQDLPKPKPIEIEMITQAPIEEKEPEPEVIKQKESDTVVRRASARKPVEKPPTRTRQAPKPRPKTQTQQQSKAKKYQPPKKVKKTQQATTTNPVTTKPTTTVVSKRIVTAKNANVSNTTPAPATNQGETADTSADKLKSQQETAAQEAREAEERKKQEAIQAEKDRLAAAAAAQAEKDAEAADAKKAAEEAASNTPVAFNINDARWARKPDFTGLGNQKGTLNIGFTVTKQGMMKDVSVKSVGLKGGGGEIKKARDRLKKAKIKPFMKNGSPVVGRVNFSIELKP